MATKTLTGSGNHTDAIWSPAGTPGADDDVIFDADYSLTVVSDWTVKSVSGGNPFGATRTFNVADGVVFTCLGDFSLMYTYNQASIGILQLGAGSVFEADFATDKTISPNYADGEGRGRIICNGTAQNPSVFRSIGNGSCTIGSRSNGALCEIEGDHVVFDNIEGGVRVSNRVILKNASFENGCGTFLAHQITAGNDFTLENLTHDSTGICLDIQSIADPTSTQDRSITNVRVSGSINWDVCGSVHWKNFHPALGTNYTGNGYKGTFEYCWIDSDTWEGFLPSNTLDAVLNCIVDKSTDFTNPHILGGRQVLNLNGVIFSLSSPVGAEGGDNGDCIMCPAYPETDTPVSVKNCIQLAEDPTGAYGMNFLSMQAHPDLVVAAHNNTVIHSAPFKSVQCVNVGETQVTPEGALDWYNNICVSDVSIGSSDIANVTDDAITADHNCTFDIDSDEAGSNPYSQPALAGKFIEGYGTGDVNQNPSFKNLPGASVSAWAVSLGCSPSLTGLQKRAYALDAILNGDATVADFFSYIRDCLTPTNEALLVGRGEGEFIGAVEPDVGVTCTIDETITVSNSFPTTVGRLSVDVGGTIAITSAIQTTIGRHSEIDETITVSNSFPTTVGRLTVDMGGTLTVNGGFIYAPRRGFNNGTMARLWRRR